MGRFSHNIRILLKYRVLGKLYVHTVEFLASYMCTSTIYKASDCLSEQAYVVYSCWHNFILNSFARKRELRNRVTILGNNLLYKNRHI